MAQIDKEAIIYVNFEILQEKGSLGSSGKEAICQTPERGNTGTARCCQLCIASYGLLAKPLHSPPLKILGVNSWSQRVFEALKEP